MYLVNGVLSTNVNRLAIRCLYFVLYHATAVHDCRILSHEL